MSIGKYHFSVGLHLRNNLLRHHEKSDALISFFNSHDIHHLDDMSSIILTSYHRYLNKENVELQSQVEGYVAYWKPIIICDKRQKLKAEKLYNNYKVGDSLQIKIPVDNYNGIDYNCPKIEWEFDEVKDLIIRGVVVKKNIMYEDTSMFFDIQILYKNHSMTKIFSREANIGDEFRMHLSTAWEIESVN